MKPTGPLVLAITLLFAASEDAIGGPDAPAPAATHEAPVALPDGELEKLQGTSRDLRRLGTALLSWAASEAGGGSGEERSRLAAEARSVRAAAGPATKGIYVWREESLRALSHSELSRMLRPTAEIFYIRNLPKKDRWGSRYEVLGLPENPLLAELFAVRSAGPNRRFDGPGYPTGAWEAGAENDDIVWAGGAFVRWPAAVASELE